MGVLSLPSAMHTLGAVPAVIIITLLGLLTACKLSIISWLEQSQCYLTTESQDGCVILGNFKKRHPGGNFYQSCPTFDL
jgi:hypothetical protein